MISKTRLGQRLAELRSFPPELVYFFPSPVSQPGRGLWTRPPQRFLTSTRPPPYHMVETFFKQAVTRPLHSMFTSPRPIIEEAGRSPLRAARGMARPHMHTPKGFVTIAYVGR